MNFIMSYSCGKDSTMALHEMLAAGHCCRGLLVMVDAENDRSYFHGATMEILEGYSRAFKVPLVKVSARGEEYHLEMERALLEAKEMGVEAVCFGDIDIEGNRAWGEERCRRAGLRAEYPLWQVGREENVKKILSLGYKCLIKSVNPNLLEENLVGQFLNEEILKKMKQKGVDLCGENGEYHTLVVDGPIFQTPLEYHTGRILRGKHHVSLEVW